MKKKVTCVNGNPQCGQSYNKHHTKEQACCDGWHPSHGAHPDSATWAPPLRVWLADEFRDWADNLEKRDDLAWDAVHQSFLDPSGPPANITDVEEAAQEYAEYFYSQRDGYECTWPVDFVVHDRELGKYFTVSVGVDYDPSFHPSRPIEMPPTPSGNVSMGDMVYAKIGDDYIRFKVDGWQDDQVIGITEDHRPIACSRSLLTRQPPAPLNTTSDTATNDHKEKPNHG